MGNSMAFVWREHKQNIRLITKMAVMNMGKQTVRSTLGIFWTYFHDFIYILVFIVFRMLIAGGGDIMGMDSTFYMVSGMIPWFFLNDVLTQGSMAIRSNQGIVQSIRFPVVVLPTVEVCSILLKRMFTFAVLFVIAAVYGYMRTFRPMLFLYYLLCSVVLSVAMNLVISALVAVSDDFKQLYDALLRVLIYTVPILWDFSYVDSAGLHVLLRLNPMVYVIKGFRSAFVYGSTQNAGYAVYFWMCVLLFFAAGSCMQDRLKRYYADFV